MKKHLCLTLIVSTLVLNHLHSQLAGHYTIDNTLPTAASNFSTFSDFASELNTAGVCGAVFVDVQGSLSYTEQVTFNQAPGSSSINVITINGNGRTLTFAGNPSQPWTLLFNGADYMTFNFLNVAGTGTAAQSCHLYNDADNLTFMLCNFTSPIGNNALSCPFSISGSSNNLSTNGSAAKNTSVLYCTLTGGFYGLRFTGNSGNPASSGNTISNCIVQDFFAYGMYIESSPSTLIRSCLVKRPTVSPVLTFYGVYMTTNCQGTTLDGNCFEQPFNAVPSSTAVTYGIYVNSNGSSTLPIKVQNNLMHNFKSNGTIYGIYNASSSFVYFDHNTLCFTDSTNSGNVNTYGIYNMASSCRVKNNLICLARGTSGMEYGLYYGVTTPTGTAGSNGNWVYSFPNYSVNTFFGYNNGAFATHSVWTNNTGMDVLGGNSNPQLTYPPVSNSFVPSSSMLNNSGEAIGLLYDYHSSQRYFINPDPGAFESSASFCTANITYTLGQNGVVSFSASITPSIALNNQYYWNLGNNSTYTNTGTPGTSTSATYSPAGYYAVQLTVINPSISCITSANANLIVNPCNLYASFNHTIGAGGLVNLASTSTGTSPSSTYTWNFGNGFSSNSSNPSLTYTNAGYYIVSMTVSNGAGCVSTSQDSIHITNVPCVANAGFSMVPTATAQYWQAVPVSPWNISQASWNWGDGSPSTNTLYASHQYSAAGLYSICLTVTVNCNATASSCSTYSIFKGSQNMSVIYVNVLPPALQSLPSGTVSTIENIELDDSILLVPNPNKGRFSIQGFGKFSGSVKVFSIKGELLLDCKLEQNHETNGPELNLEQLAEGLYILKIEKGNSVAYKKLLISR